MTKHPPEALAAWRVGGADSERKETMSDLLESLQNAANFAQSDYLTWGDGADVMLEAKARIEALEAERDELRGKLAAVVAAAEEMSDAFYSNGNVTERHLRACHAGVKLLTTVAELKESKNE